MSVRVCLLVLVLHATACTALQPATEALLAVGRAHAVEQQFPDLGGLVSGAVAGAVNQVEGGVFGAVGDPLVVPLQAAVKAANQTLAAMGDELRMLEVTVHEMVVDMQAKIVAASHHKAAIFQQNAIEVLKNASDKLGAVTVAMERVIDSASYILTVVGLTEMAETFRKETADVVATAYEWKFHMDSMVRSLKAVKETGDELVDGIRIHCRENIADLVGAADTVKGMAADFQRQFAGLVENVTAAIKDKLPQPIMDKLTPVIRGLSAQASMQLSPAAEIAAELAAGLKSGMELAGITATQSQSNVPISLGVTICVLFVAAAGFYYYRYVACQK